MLVVRDEKGPVGEDGKEPPDPDRWWVMLDRPALSGTDLKNPEQNFDQRGGGQPIVTFDFTDKGRKAFQEITRRIAQRGADNTLPGVPADNASQQFAIVLDDDLVSKPFINFQENPDGIDGSTGAQISGGFTITSAQDLAKILQIGALPIKLELISRSQVSASLGAQALDQGLVAGIAGLAIVALFLIAFYRVLGVIASVALLIYALYFYALVKAVPVTLTLPGIAGLILTLGVAADANIVIFERVKEEIRAGRGVRDGDHQRLPQGPDGDHRRQRRHAAGRLHPVHPRDRGGEGLRVHARPGRDRVAVHGRAGHAGDPVLAARHAPDPQPRRPRRLRAALQPAQELHGRVEVVLLRVRRDHADRRVRDRRQRPQLRHRLRGRHADHRAARAAPSTSSRCARRSPRSGLADAEVQTIDNPELGRNLVQISSRRGPGPHRGRAQHALENQFGFAGEPTRSRSARPSARASRARR